MGNWQELTVGVSSWEIHLRALAKFLRPFLGYATQLVCFREKEKGRILGLLISTVKLAHHEERVAFGIRIF